MGDNFMRVVYCTSNSKPRIMKIHKDLQSISELIETNFFETVLYKDMLLIYDPKGLLKYSTYKELEGLKLRGPFIFTGNDTLENDFKSLNIKQIRYLQKALEETQEEIEEIEI